MSKQNNKQKHAGRQAGQAAGTRKSRFASSLGSVFFIGLVAGIVWTTKHFSNSNSSKSTSAPALSQTTQQVKSASGAQAPALSSTNPSVLRPAPELTTMEINKAVMVTVELDFGPAIPSISEALNFIERRYQPDDGKGRTFAILDAYGEPTPDNKKLHISMHVSTEKPGMASLVFSKTGEVLWQTKILPSTNANVFSGKDLTMYLDSGLGDGKAWMLDGSLGPSSVLDAKVRDLNKPVRDVWLDGEEREVTLIYSACGCPVKVKAKRAGDRTLRTKELPVIFPDDPAAVAVINKLMGW